MPNRPIVGTKAFYSFVQQMREAYPDLAYEVQQVGATRLQQQPCSSFTQPGTHMRTVQPRSTPHSWCLRRKGAYDNSVEPPMQWVVEGGLWTSRRAAACYTLF